MFEGFVSQVLAGYLGRYVKGIQKDQLRIGIWNEEVLLDNVELILEAFDYLRLPFALKQGKIGKLSIKIPWKKLGWDPIVIILEDVFICACSHGKDDWSLDSVEKRELAWKLATLNAAELAKFSRRFYGNQVGQYIFAKILDNIQVSIKNVHIVYIDTHTDPEKFIFGLRFSSLTVMTDTQKQNSMGSSYGILKAAQVKKILKISTLGIYCNMLDDNMSFEDDPMVMLCHDSKFDPKRYDYLINPFDLTIHLLVNKTGMFDSSPEYSLVAELTSVVVLLNEIQLLQILSLWDHLSVCSLKERYGRYQPDHMFLSRRVRGWQTLWWHYAQQSVLADVRRRLRKTSWSTLGRRIIQRRKYVDLYRRKLEFIQQNLHVSEEILEELAQMDRECEIDEILSYRTTAENQIQEFVLQKKDSATGTSDIPSSQDKGQSDESSSTRLRGWLNWLSLGMLGAGGTADSSSFAGVVSDEIIKDICEAADSQSLPAYAISESSQRNMIFSSAVKFDIDHFTMTISSKKQDGKDIALMFLDGVDIECKISEESMDITLLTKSAKITNPCNDSILLTSEKISDGDGLTTNTPCICTHIKVLPADQTFDLSIEAILQSISITYDLDFLKDVSKFLTVLESIQFQSQRVMLSFNGFADVNARVLSKAEYVFLTWKRIIWNVNVHDVVIKVPEISAGSESHIMVLKFGTLHLMSKSRCKNSAVVDIKEHFSDSIMNMLPAYNLPSNFKLDDLYEHLEIDLTNLEGKFVSTKSDSILPAFGEFSATIILSLCMFFDEPILKQMNAHCSVSSFDTYMSPLLFDALSRLGSKEKEKVLEEGDAMNASSVAHLSSLNLSWCSASIHFEHFNFILDLDDDQSKSPVISICLADSNIRYTFCETVDFRVLVKSMKISGRTSKSEEISYNICTSRCVELISNGFEAGHSERCLLGDECFAFYYLGYKNGSGAHSKCTIELSEFDFHIHPKLVGILQESCSRQFINRENSDDKSLSSPAPGFFQSPKVNDISLASHNEICLPRIQIVDINADQPSLKSRSFGFFTVDFNLRQIRAHFHDSSSVLATLNCPLLWISFSIKGVDSWETFCQSDGLNLTSPWSNTSWSSPKISDILCGPSSPTTAPTLNLHIKRFRNGEESIVMETYVTLQHVNCILLPEFLAMVIGYVSLPYWIPARKGQHAAEDEHFYCRYKFEILDSSLSLPVENKAYFLEISLPKLSGTFIPTIHSTEAIKSMPTEYQIPQVEIPDMLHLVKVSLRGTSLAVVLCDDGTVGPMFGLHSNSTNVTLLPLLDADVWVTIPQNEHNAVPTFIMLKSDDCNLIIEDEWFLQGLEAMATCIDELSTVGDDSKNFIFDALQYVQLKRKLKETNSAANISAQIPFDIRICANALSLKLVHSVSSEVIALVDTKVMFLARFRNDMVHKIDADIMHIVMHSSLNPAVLLTFLPEDYSIYMNISFSRSDEGGNEFQIFIPALDIWLHYSGWNKVITFFTDFEGFSDHALGLTLESSPSESKSQSDPEKPCVGAYSGILASGEHFDGSRKTVYFIVKSSKIVLSLHLPLDHMEVSINEKEAKEPLGLWKNILGASAQSFQGLDSRYLTFTLQSRDTVLALGESMLLKCNVGRMKMLIKMTEKQGLHSTSIIQFFLGKVAAEIQGRPPKVSLTISDAKVETVTMNLIKEIVKISKEMQFAASGVDNWGMPLHSVFFHIYLAKLSLLLSDQRLRSSGSIFDITCKNMLVEGKSSLKLTAKSHLSVNYKNFQKAMWEPFIEPWSFYLELIQHVTSGSPSRPNTTDLFLSSRQELNLNVTESLVEAIFLMHQMVNETVNINGSYPGHGSCSHLTSEPTHNMLRNRTPYMLRTHAPYIISNETSLSLSFWVFYGSSTSESSSSMSIKQRNTIQPGFSVPIYVEEHPETNLPKRAAYSSEKLLERQLNSVSHHHISVQLDGTSSPSKPMSMDLVGISYFDVNFSKSGASEPCIVTDEEASLKGRDNESYIANPLNGFLVPVVFDVSMHFYSKMIRLYSTVLLLNATSKSLELRFDIPFGVSPKILGPILPGQEFPLPVHLAEAVGMRWRPVDSNYFWSEAHSLSKILSHESRLGFMRSFVCYPSFPKSDPFRCCISVEDRSLIYPYGSKGGSSLHINNKAGKVMFNRPEMQDHGKSEKIFIRQVRLTTPLLVKNYLPSPLTVTVDSAGVMTSISLSEVNAASIFHIDATHDLEITFKLEAYNPVTSKFPRAETFTGIARLDETRFLTSDRLTFYSSKNNGPVCLKVDKLMDAYCGAREICISVPFLLYNCTGLPLGIIDDDLQHKGLPHFIPPSYSLVGDKDPCTEIHGISVLTSRWEMVTNPSYSSKTYKPSLVTSEDKHAVTEDLAEGVCVDLAKSVYGGSKVNQPSSSANTILPENVGKVKPYMYSPPSHLPESDIMVRLQRFSLQQRMTDNWTGTWSSSFSLVPASGSTSVVIPQPGRSGAFLVSVTSSQVSGDLCKMSRAIIFQPRYVICNCCSKPLYYKQKGSSDSHSIRLGVGQHSHLHWTDRARDLLVCIRFDERGGQWSGSFLPDFLGDTQVKVRNHASGALDMVRIEIQNAGMLDNERKDVDISSGNSGTYLILLSDDDSGFMPYRIDNFSMESLRIYQQKCETAEITVRPYTSCQYAWDEPCCPHRLVVEVPGEHLLGTYNLDDVKEYPPVCLPSSSEKPERRFFVAVCAEGATKVLSIVDSRYHSLKDIKDIDSLGMKGKRKLSQKEERNVNFSERIILHLPFIGISLINSSPQELIYASIKETLVILTQSSDRQKVSFQISSFQIDNQLPNAPYPILLSFDHEPRGGSSSSRNNESIMERHMGVLMATAFEDANDSDLYFAASKWRKESSFISFEYITSRVAPLSIELEELVLLQILAFLRAVSSRLENGPLGNENSERCAVECDPGGRNHIPNSMRLASCHFQKRQGPLPLVIPIGAPWQKICLLARHQKRIYIETFELAQIRLTVSFSSNPWLMKKEEPLEAESFLYIRSIAFQRGLMALVDVEGVPFHLKELILSNFMASQESIQEIVSKHYTKQLLHEIYKIFGSAGLIGNPMGFARNVGIGIKDFFLVSSKGIVQSPAGLITGVAQGSKSLIGNTVYAMSSTASQFSKAVHKGIVAFTFNEHVASKREKQQNGHDSQAKGILNEFLEGLTGLLQSPIRGAEKHGLPGVISGIALGTAGLVARPVASILETTERAAQSIKNISSPHQSKRFRTRLPRPLARDLPLSPYSWEEAIGVSMLLEADGSRLKDEIFIKCRALKSDGKFIIITERVVMIVYCSALVGLGKPGFLGVGDAVVWAVEAEMSINSILHMDREVVAVNIVGSEGETLSRHKKNERLGVWDPPASVPLFQMSMELPNEEAAEDVLQTLCSIKEQGNSQSRNLKIIHRSNLR